MSDNWVRELVGEDVLMKGKLGAVSTVSTAAWENKVVALYFSASWCPPCQEFTPRLVGIYTEAQRKHKDFELIFVSHDKTIEQFQVQEQTYRNSCLLCNLLISRLPAAARR